MADIKFSCPECKQHIQCDLGYAGQEIACPTCSTALVVPGPAGQPPPAIAAAVGCPECGAALAPDAALCTQCGYNLVTGQRLQVQTQATPPPRPGAFRPGAAPMPQKPGFSLSNPNVVAGIVLAAFMVLSLLGQSSPQMALVYVGAAGVYSLVVGIMVLVKAFQESTGTGFLTLCVPCYNLYFVYWQSDSPMLKALFSIMIIAQIASSSFQSTIESLK